MLIMDSILVLMVREEALHNMIVMGGNHGNYDLNCFILRLNIENYKLILSIVYLFQL